MQRLTYQRPKDIGRWQMLYTVLFCIAIHTPAQSQSVSQPDSFVMQQHTIRFQPKPVTTKSFILPAVLITTGALGTSGEFIISNPETKEIRDRNFSTFHTSFDNYLQFAPVVAGYGLLISNKEHSFRAYTEKVVVTEVVVVALVEPSKHITRIKRPDGSPDAFPSGHTTQAFASATLFSDEFAQYKPWLAAMAYVSATAVGVLRILNNDHWASDVIAGAGFGILSAKASEWIVDSYNKKHHFKHTYTYQF